METNVPGKIIFKCIVGSQAYGTNTPESDIDIKGVYIQDKSDVIGFNKYKPQIEINKDEVYFEIGRFLELLQKGNPTMMELIFSPDDCVLEYTEEWNILLQYKDKFITQECRNSFIGYAESQIKKASGTDKKFNWEENHIVRKEPLDFCYVILTNAISTNMPIKQGVMKLKDWMYHKVIKQENCVFNKLDHSQDVYQLYHCLNKITKGLQSENGNDIRLDSSEKDTYPIASVIFNKNAYSIHCKQYREYKDWLDNRNTQRYVDINSHGQKIDGKNMLHCTRLLRMGEEIMNGKGVIVRREDADELISIRKGKFNLAEILELAQQSIERLKTVSSNLPEKISDNIINSLLLNIRNFEENQGYTLHINNEEWEKYKEWRETINDLPYLGAVGGHFGLSVYFTGIGEIIKGTYLGKDEIDLTDYETM